MQSAVTRVCKGFVQYPLGAPTSSRYRSFEEEDPPLLPVVVVVVVPGYPLPFTMRGDSLSPILSPRGTVQ